MLVVVELGSFRARVAWFDRVGPGAFALKLQSALPADLGEESRIRRADETLFFEVPERWDFEMSAGENGELLFAITEAEEQALVDVTFAAIVPGDPNRNGQFGAESSAEAAALIVPGNPEASYLWRRITGTVPGSRMPLANDPITNPQYLALACWIESAIEPANRTPHAFIDYEHCSYFTAPQLFDTAVE